MPELQSSTSFPSTFKAAVALEALKATHSIDELSSRFAVPVPLIREWVDTLRERAAEVFSEQAQRKDVDTDIFSGSELAMTIAENSTQGFAMMDQRGYCVYANKAWLEMTGYSEEEISSQPLHYLVHHHHPDGTPYPMEECPIDRALPENFDVRAHEDVFFRKDGSTFDVACAASPIFKAGKPVATVIEIRDVTDQKKQARAHIENEHRAVKLAREAQQQRLQLKAFLDAAPVGIGMADPNGKLIVINRANKELWGENIHLAEDLQGYKEFKGWWADEAEHHGTPVSPDEWALARALRGVDVDNDIVEIEPFDAPGLRKTVSLSARPIRDERGAIVGGVVVQVDITAQRKAELALRQADRNKDDFIAILAHELRNPLAPIRAAVDLFKMRVPGDPVLKRATGAMARQIDHITRLVDDLLDVARISRGKVELKLETCDLVRIVTQTVEDYRPAILSNGVVLDLQSPSQPVWVKGDSARLAQIIGNLLHNASKFTRNGHRILVDVSTDFQPNGEYVTLTVHDNGAGMSQELVSSLFNPFVQAAQGLGRSAGGLGLGLALVKGLAELHGGSVGVQSPGPGQGSTFTVRFPVTARPINSETEIEENDSNFALRIVAIDDNQDALEMLGLLLTAMGHEVELANDSTSGLEKIRQVRPDVVICDIGLPGEMSGYDIVRIVRAEQDLDSTSMIALSGYGQASDKQRSILAGFQSHLVKPVLIDALKNELTKVHFNKVGKR